MNLKKIIFHSNKEYNSLDEKYYPVPASKSIPKWFVDASRYWKNPSTGEVFVGPNGEKTLTFKACPALMDMYTSGYFFVTPCDIEFYNKDGIPYVNVPENFKDFVGERDKMEGFDNPDDYYEKHFHWYPNWAPEVPEGYSVLYINPLNQFNLPFLTIAGVIDNDRMTTPGNMPFFIKKNFTGIIPKGTPFVQLIPFKRDNWNMEIQHHDRKEIHDRCNEAYQLIRGDPELKNGGGYKKFTWSRKKFD
jgi:hypothetical protein